MNTIGKDLLPTLKRRDNIIKLLNILIALEVMVIAVELGIIINLLINNYK